MSNRNFQPLSNFIWSVADLLRGPYRPPQYERVMLPMTVLRRFDCVLEHSKNQILAKHVAMVAKNKTLPAAKQINDFDPTLNKIAKDIDGRELGFHNHSPLNFQKLKGDPDNVGRHLQDYINGFSKNIREIFDKFEFVSTGDVIVSGCKSFEHPRRFKSRSEYHRQGWEGWERFDLYQPELSERIGGHFESLRLESDHGIEQLSPLNAALQLDQGTVLADRLLFKGDCSTMAFGLEARAPLLDHNLADVAGQLPLRLKVTGSKTKVALREIASRYLPADIINRRKKGFSMPLDTWFRNELRDWTRSCLLDESITLPRFFQRAAIEKLLKEHAAGKNHAQRIHTLLMFELWSRAYAP